MTSIPTHIQTEPEKRPQDAVVRSKRVTILPKKNLKQPAIPWHSWVLLVVVVGICFVLFYFFHGLVLKGWVRWSLTVAWLLANVGLGIYDFLLPRIPGQGGITDSTPIDRWTLAHTGSGLVLGLWYTPIWVVLAITIGWEIFEINVVGFGDQEILKNRIVDVAVAVVGWLLIVLVVMGVAAVGSGFPIIRP